MYVSLGAGGATHPLSCFGGGVGSGGLCGYLYSALEQIRRSLHNSVQAKEMITIFNTITPRSKLKIAWIFCYLSDKTDISLCQLKISNPQINMNWSLTL